MIRGGEIPKHQYGVVDSTCAPLLLWDESLQPHITCEAVRDFRCKKPILTPTTKLRTSANAHRRKSINAWCARVWLDYGGAAAAIVSREWGFGGGGGGVYWVQDAQWVVEQWAEGGGTPN